MTETNSRKVVLGLFLLAISSVLVFGPGVVATATPVVLIAMGTLGLAAGALLVGTSSSGRPV
jgi:hypothetical protein